MSLSSNQAGLQQPPSLLDSEYVATANQPRQKSESNQQQFFNLHQSQSTSNITNTTPTSQSPPQSSPPHRTNGAKSKPPKQHHAQSQPQSGLFGMMSDERQGEINRQNKRVITGPINMNFAETDLDHIPKRIMGPICDSLSSFCFGTRPGVHTISHMAFLWMVFGILCILVAFMSMTVYSPGRSAYRHLDLRTDYINFQESYRVNEFMTHYWVEDFSLNGIPPLRQDDYKVVENALFRDPIDPDTSPTYFQFNMHATDHYTTRHYAANTHIGTLNTQPQSTKIPQLQSDDITPQEGPEQATLPIFHYFHDRTFFAFPQTYTLANISLPFVLWIESFITTSFYNFLYPVIFTTLNAIQAVTNLLFGIDLPSILLDFFRYAPRVYSETPIDPTLTAHTAQITTLHPMSIWIRIFKSPFFYFLFFVIFAITMLLLFVHLFHQGYLATHPYIVTIQFSFFTALHCAFIIMYRFSFHKSSLLQLYATLYPFLLAAYFSTKHVLFSSFVEPYVQLRVPAYISVLTVYCIFILSGWLLAGDALAGDIITIFVLYLLPIFTLGYFINAFITLYHVLSKLQQDFITLNFSNMSIPQLIDQTEARKEVLTRYLEEWEAYEDNLSSNGTTDHGMGPKLDILIRPFYYRRIINRYQASQQSSGKGLKAPKSGLASHGIAATITPSPEDVYPIPPTTLLHRRLIRITVVALFTYIVILLARKLGLSHVYFTMMFAAWMAFCTTLGFSNPIIPVPRVRLPTWLQELSPEETFGHDRDAYRFDVPDDDVNFSLTPMQQRYKDALEFEKLQNEQLEGESVKRDINGNIIPAKRTLQQPQQPQQAQQLPQKTTSKGGTTYVSLQSNADSDLSDIDVDIELDRPYPPPNTLPSQYHSKPAPKSQHVQFARLAQDDVENDLDLNDGVELHPVPGFLRSTFDDQNYHDDEEDDADGNTGFVGQSNFAASAEQYADEMPVLDDDGDRITHQQLYLTLNAPKSGCTELVWIIAVWILVFASLFLTAGQFEIFSPQFDHSKPYVYSLNTFQLETQSSLLESPIILSTQSVQQSLPQTSTFSTQNESNTVKPVMVNPELEQTIENIFLDEQINPGWANLLSGCYGQSSLTPGADVTGTIPHAAQSPNSAGKKELPNTKNTLSQHKNDITTTTITKHVELNMLKQLFFNQYEAFFRYLDHQKQIVATSHPSLKQIAYPDRPFNRIVDALILRNQRRPNDDTQQVLQDWPILFTKSPFFPPQPLSEVHTTTPLTDLKSLFDNRMVSLAMPYHVLYSLYSMHYTSPQTSPESEKEHEQKVHLDSIVLPLRAQWHSYSSVATQDELVVRCQLDPNDHEGLSKWGYSSTQRVFDIKVYLLSYLSCDHHVAQSLIVHEDIEVLRRCGKVNVNQGQPSHQLNQSNQIHQTQQDPSIQDELHSGDMDSQQVNHAEIHLGEKLGLPTDEITTTAQFLLSHFHSIIVFHDRSKAQAFHSTETSPQEREKEQPIYSHSSIETQGFSSQKSITSPLPRKLVHLIDYANHYFAISIIFLVFTVFFVITFIFLSFAYLNPSVKHVD